jgi:predicted peptidase
MKIKLLFITFLISIWYGVFSQEIQGSFSKEIKTKLELNYILQLPTNQKEKFPLLVFLHGSGERGIDLALVKNHSPFTYQELIKSPIAILAPQCPLDVWWDTTAVYELIQETISKYNIDTSRIYLTGLSMGGWGTWKLAIEHPELFAAVAPVCAPIDVLMLINASKLNMPIRIYHGALDDVVLAEDSILMHQELKKENKSTELFIFPNDDHNSWDSTYSNPEFYIWLLSQQKK